MLRYLAAASIFAMAVPLASSQVIAQERAGDAALGALSGAVVLGPIGAVAGALVGYTAGPNIAHSWGMRSSPHKPARSATAAPPAPKGSPAPLPRARPDAAPAAPSVKSEQTTSAGNAATPPVQSYE